jgi:hypothetical protein
MKLTKLHRNIGLFTLGLFIVTLGIEYYKKGTLAVEQPLIFILVITILGIIGGQTITWVSQGK